MSDIAVTFNALVELPELEEKFFSDNMWIMMRTATSLILNSRKLGQSVMRYNWDNILDAREEFVNRYKLEYTDYLQTKYPNNSSFPKEFFMKARQNAIPIIIFVFEEALALTTSLAETIEHAQ